MRSIAKHLDAFGISRSVTRMSDLPPMKVNLNSDAAPFKIPSRWVGGMKKEAMREKLEMLERIGMIQADEDPLWGSPGFMVGKIQRSSV